MAKSFVFATRGGEYTDHVMQAMRKLNKESDRAAAIVGGSIVETALTQALTALMHPDKKITDEMFRPTGALGAFASKIRLGYLIGLFDREGYRDLSTIKDIRNTFAHSLDVSDFNDQRVKAWAMNLTLAEKYSAEMSPSQGRTQETVLPGTIGVIDCDEMLKIPRERFLIEAQVLSHLLMIPIKSAMPKPLF